MKNARKWLVILIALSLVVSFAGMAMSAEKKKSKKININKASAQEMTALKWTADQNLSLEQAKQIVKYRKKNGPFRNPEDIKDVPGGFGILFYIDNKDVITVK